jgi:hypothetical protein
MRVKEEGVFKMHCEDKDEILPIVFTQRRHEQPPSLESNNLAAMIKNWRLRERVMFQVQILILIIQIHRSWFCLQAYSYSKLFFR